MHSDLIKEIKDHELYLNTNSLIQKIGGRDKPALGRVAISDGFNAAQTPVELVNINYSTRLNKATKGANSLLFIFKNQDTATLRYEDVLKTLEKLELLKTCTAHNLIVNYNVGQFALAQSLADIWDIGKPNQGWNPELIQAIQAGEPLRPKDVQFYFPAQNPSAA